MREMRQYGVVPVSFILLALLLCAPRPVTRVRGGTHCRWGLNQFIFSAEPVGDSDAPLAQPRRADVPLAVPMVVGTVLLVLKTRRSGHVSVTVRRLRLPSRKASRSLLTD